MHLIKTIITTLFATLLFASIASGQNPKIDSLERLLNKHIRADTARVNLLNALAYELHAGDREKAQSYAQQSQDLCTKLNYPEGKAASLWTMGLAIMKSDKKGALDLFNEALKIATEVDDKVGVCNYQTAIGGITKTMGDMQASNEAYDQAFQTALKLNDKLLLLKCRFNLGNSKSSAGSPVEAAQQFQEAVKLATELSDEAMLARAYAALGVIHFRQGNAPTALEYYLQALHLNEKLNHYPTICSNLVNIAGIQSSQNDEQTALATLHKSLEIATQKRDSTYISTCYTNIGNIYKKMNNPEALDYFQKALVLSRYAPVSQTINVLANLGETYMIRGEFDAAMHQFDQALALAQKAGIQYAMGEVYITMGISCIEQKKYSQAKEYVEKSLEIAENIHYTELQKDCYLRLSEIYAATGNFKQAYASHKQHKLLFDELFNESNARKIALLESSYQFAKEREVYEIEKSRRELRIKSQRQTIVSLVLISLLVILLAVAIYWSDRLKKKVMRLEIEHMNRELEANQKAMAVAKLKLVQNSERDANTVKILEDIGKSTVGGQKSLSALINNYKLQTNHSNWEEFEILFTKVNTSFWDKLNELCPELTPNERKLCVFLKLNMNNKDIALITLQSEEALKKSRLRLRKKFDLDRSTNLSSFIQSL